MNMLTPEQLGRPPTEAAQQTALFCWIAQTGRRIDIRLEWAYHVANGGTRDRITAGRLKAEGVKAGVWDVHVPIASQGYHGLWIEMKKPGLYDPRKPGNGLSKEQREFGMAMYAGGFKTAVCYTWREGVQAIADYLGINEDLRVD